MLVIGGSGFIGSELLLTLSKRYEVVNFDINPPLTAGLSQFFTYCDIRDRDTLHTMVQGLKPHHVVNLAAVTKQDAENLEDFDVNILGCKNLIEVLKTVEIKGKVIFTSTQHVQTPGFSRKVDFAKFKPYGKYGLSKFIGELLVQNSSMSNWIIVRPTLIWGPNHPVLVNGLWRLMKSRRYFHPSRDRVVKNYGYVRNTTQQIVTLLESNDELVLRRTFYLGDANIEQSKWVDAFSILLTGKPSIKVPVYLIKAIALIGEFAKKTFGMQPPIYISRYRNLITSNVVDVSPIIELTKGTTIDFDTAVKETIDLL